MTLATLSADMMASAERLAEFNAQSEPNIKEIYLFPHSKEIRLVALDESTLPDVKIAAFHFPAAPKSDINYPFAIALIRPEEKDFIKPPRGWGHWVDAIRIWPGE